MSDFDANVGLEYAAFLQRRGSIARAEDVLIGLNKRRPNNIGGHVDAGRSQVGAPELGPARRKSPSRFGRWVNNGGRADQILGVALVGRNKYDEAIAAFQNAYNAAPTATQPIDSLVGHF